MLITHVMNNLNGYGKLSLQLPFPLYYFEYVTSWDQAVTELTEVFGESYRFLQCFVKYFRVNRMTKNHLNSLYR